MKGIIVEDCLNYLFSDIESPEVNGGTLICTLGKSIECEEEELCKMEDEILHTIPDWCRLDDLQEVVESAILEHNVKYKGIVK